MIARIQQLLDTKIGSAMGTMLFGAALGAAFVYGWL